MRLQAALRTMALATACAAAGSGIAAAQERAAFTIYRDGKPIGRHVVETIANGNRQTVHIESQITVQAGERITLYRYRHRAQEEWDGARLMSMDSQTDDNGKPFRVIVQRAASGLAVRATVPEVEQASTVDRTMSLFAPQGEKLVEQIVPFDVMPTSWSHAAVLRQSRLLSSLTGAVNPVTFDNLGTEVVQTGLGQIPATRWRMTSVSRQDIWYDARGRWLKSTFRGKDGSTVEAVRDR